MPVKKDDHDGLPFRVMEWLKRFRNIFTQLVTASMMRHEKSMLFRGRATLLVLPEARVEIIRVQLTAVQRAAYKLLYEFAKKRFEAFKASGDAVRKTIEILQLLVPLRQACSAATVNIDLVKQQEEKEAEGEEDGESEKAGLEFVAFTAVIIRARETSVEKCTCIEMGLAITLEQCFLMLRQFACPPFRRDIRP